MELVGQLLDIVERCIDIKDLAQNKAYRAAATHTNTHNQICMHVQPPMDMYCFGDCN